MAPAYFLCNASFLNGPNVDVFNFPPCLENQDLNYISLCFRKVVTQLTGIWRAENASSFSLPAFVMQLFVILSLNRLLTMAFLPLHISRISAEILGGVILGPCVLGFTTLTIKHIVPWGTLQNLENIASVGLIYFMFIVGLEVDLKPVLRGSKKSLTTALAGIIISFPIGYALHYLLIDNFAVISQDKPNRFGPLFWGLSIATTNFPDLAGLLADLKLLHTDVGRTSLTSSVVSDLICWFLFILTMATAHKGRAFTVVTTTIYIGFCFFIVRPNIKGVGAGSIMLVIVLAFVAKIFSTFLVAFFVNKMSARDSVALGLLMNTKGLLSLIIINAGRDLLALDMQTFAVIVFALWVMTAAVGPILFLTYKSKRRPGEYKYRTIRSVEGNSELRILACLHSTRNAGGLVSLLKASNPTKQSPISAFAVLLVELIGHASAMLIVHDTYKPNAPGGGDGGAAKDVRSQYADGVLEAFENLEDDNFSIQSLTAISAYSTMHEDICSLAEDKRVTLTIIPFHIDFTAEGGGAAVADSRASSPFRAVNKNVLDNAPCSVAVFVDRGFSTHLLDVSNSGGIGGFRHKIAVLFVGGRDDREALAYAWRIAKGPQESLTVERFVPGKNSVEVDSHIPGFDDDEEHEDGGILKAIADSEREKQLDDQFIEEFKLKTREDPSTILVEQVANNGDEVVKLVSGMEGRYDFYIVGRGKGVVSPLTSGLSDWSEFPELGPLGDILVCSSFAADASVMIVQQGAGSVDEEGISGQVREQFGHMTWHPPEMNSCYAPFIHRRVRITDDDDHL
ncbi:hypothetical protein TIFTF001_030148 [Ficus carica]|uniref:Cation/H+ exchanger domain-containing protein n=1 Tax=Ficus carica TaxID=3494 RepID=A0AA88DX20_FICCA|nr:hypothetical protein TIFTF001_030148 [Ficus carica]